MYYPSLTKKQFGNSPFVKGGGDGLTQMGYKEGYKHKKVNKMRRVTKKRASIRKNGGGDF